MPVGDPFQLNPEMKERMPPTKREAIWKGRWVQPLFQTLISVYFSFFW